MEWYLKTTLNNKKKEKIITHTIISLNFELISFTKDHTESKQVNSFFCFNFFLILHKTIAYPK